MEVIGPPGTCIGDSFARVGDVNGDRVEDFLVGDPTLASGNEIVVLFSGADGSYLHVFETPTTLIRFGSSVAGGEDIDGDQVPDLLIGADHGSTGMPRAETGSVFVYSGATKTLIREHVGLPGQNLGECVTFLDDLDNDGVAEYAAGATHEGLLSGPDEVGEAMVYSGASGSVLYPLSAGTPGDLFGWRIADVGDLDEDGVSDFGVGAPRADTQGFTSNGAVYLYSGSTGILIRKDEGIASTMQLGKALASIGDVNGDRVVDYLSTAWAGVNGAAVMSGADGSMLSYLQSPLAIGASFVAASTVDSIPDVDGNGVREVLVRYYASANRHVYIADALTAEPVYYILDEYGLFNIFPGALACAGDIDGDGLDDIAVTDPGASPTGAVYFYSIRPLVAMEDEVSAASGGAVPLEMNTGVGHAGGLYFVLTSVTPAGPMTCGVNGIPVGPVPVYIPMCFDIVMQYSLWLANAPPFLNTDGTLSAVSGEAVATFDLTGFSLPPAAVGFSFYFAYIAKDSAATSTGSAPWDFVSNVESVEITP
jgi:hypothetical protein